MVEGGCCYVGGEADGAGCLEGEALFNGWRSERVVGKMREHEILELTGEWSGEYRKLAREVERLKLAGEASLVEQDPSNDLERRRKLVDDGRAVGREVESDVEVMTSSTCFDFNESPPSSAKPRIGRESPQREFAGLESLCSCSIPQAALPCRLSENSIRVHALGSRSILYSSATRPTTRYRCMIACAHPDQHIS